jgi:iron complex outermembrane receptor protein
LQALAWAAPVYAQTSGGEEASDKGPADIIVTAQRRNESLQRVPVAITVLPSAKLASANIVTTQDLPLLTPSLSFMNVGKYGQPRIRGVGTTADSPTVENPVATYVDGVYFANQGATILSLPNIDQIEVDKGPQGTLFGRNATGGLIQIKTRDPSFTQISGNASGSYENYKTATASGYLSGPISSTIAADIAVYVRHQGDGYGTNVLTGQEINKANNLVARSKWIFKPSELTKITVIGDYIRIRGANGQSPAPGTVPLGGAPSLSGQDIAVPAPYKNNIRQGGVSLRIEQEIGDVSFLSTSAYRKSKGVDYFPNVGQNVQDLLNVQLADFAEQASQEFQLQSASVGKFEWTTGVFLYYADGGWSPIDLSGAALNGINHIYEYTDQKTYSGSVYGQGTYEIADATKLTLGLRYTADQRKWHIFETFVSPFGIPDARDQGNRTFKKVTWRASIDHRFDNGVLLYASANRGFKSGGWNDFLLPATAYEPEQLDAYEVGVKSDFFGKALRLNLSGFYYDYKNVQVNRYANGVLLIYNGAAARVFGFEAEGSARLSSRFNVDFGLSVLNDKYTSFPNADIGTPAPGGGTILTNGSAKGNRLTHTPDWTANISGTYTVPLSTGKLELSANYLHSDGFYGSVDQRLRQKPYNLVGGQIAWASPDDTWRLSVFGRNLANEKYASTLYAQANGDIAQWAPPRTYGVKVERKF